VNYTKEEFAQVIAEITRLRGHFRKCWMDIKQAMDRRGTTVQAKCSSTDKNGNILH